ncbi:EAL domain-containing protein, partial [Okeania sp. SIO2G5]|uniref:GGDEF/EAL domain-containing response regulator n=1 Tax=Okeania sp. SIO2G5 TaxID=2607796 RepID=UPI0013C293B3
QHIPVIFISALDAPLDKVKAFDVGCVDYITEPFEPTEVIVRVRHQLMLKAANARIRQLNTELESRVATRTAQLEAEVVVRKRAQDNLRYLVLHDTLTNLPNRTWFMEHLAQAIHQAKQNAQYQFAVLFFDCDHFKVINDSLGHLAGDQLLISLARRLAKCLPSNYILARLGGDEFTVFIDEISQELDAIETAKYLKENLKHPFQLEGRSIFISASIGIVFGNGTYHQPEELLRDADTAMYHAKAKGKGRYQVFDQLMYSQAVERSELEQDLRLAIQNKEFVLHYQPIFSLRNKVFEGCEALLRWHHSRNGLTFPNRFIHLAEEVGLIYPIGRWVLQQACGQIQQWQGANSNKMVQKKGQNLQFHINVNISANQLAHPDFLSDVDQLISIHNFDCQCLKLEITESALIQRGEETLTLLEELKARRIKLVIDDFGIGYSSLSYLHRFPLDTLKIDRSFIHGMHQSQKRLGIVESTINLAHTLGMNVVAEGIESQAQLETLQEFGCESGQGYFFSPPVPADKMNISQSGVG